MADIVSTPACVAFKNLADAGSVRSLSSSLLSPPQMLQNPHVARKWRGTLPTSDAVYLDLLSAVEFDAVCLLGTNQDVTGTQRVRLSNSDPTGEAGELYDSGVLVGSVDAQYEDFIHLMPAAVTARYVRIDLSQAGLSFLEAGRLVVAKRYHFVHNFGYGWDRGWVDNSTRVKSRGGQTHVGVGSQYRVLNFKFEVITEEDRMTFVEQLDMLNGEHDDILVVTNPDSTNLGRDSVWGLQKLNPVSQPHVGRSDFYSRPYQVEERL